MNIEKTIQSFKSKGYQVSRFESGKDAVEYLKNSIHGKTIGFGGSRTLTDLRLLEVLSESNEVFAPDFPKKGENFITTAVKSMNTDYYFLSANAVSENGELVNIDATGNRLAGSLFGHKKIYYVIGTNKIEETLEKAIWRARNIAAPKNAMRFNLKTPCAVKGDKCYDCRSPQRLCKGLLIHLEKIESADVEIILINENLGF